jgi:O-antigen/teichoic acid export membrane protein
VFLQAAGEFQPLATASIISAAVSLASVIVLGAVGGILWSIAGIFIGESVYAVSIWSALRRWQRRAGT